MKLKQQKQIKVGSIVERKQKFYKGIRGEVISLKVDKGFFAFGKTYPDVKRARVTWKKQGGSRAKSTLTIWIKVTSLKLIK
jgi:hypothetical protein